MSENIEAESRLRVGAQVRILDGPFRGQRGICAGIRGRGVQVQLSLLGSRRPVNVSRAMVEPVGEATERP